MDEFDKSDLKKTVDLARIEIKEGREDKLLGDLRKIISYFRELASVDTGKAALITGGTDLQNISREDDVENYELLHRGSNQFTAEKDGFLEVLPIFEKEQDSK